jgi:hypothetical protein
MKPHVRNPEEVSQTLAQIKADALALVCGLIGGVGLFIMTAWLVIKDGQQAGQHLQLLSNYFVGYSVTWPGAFIGLLYGALTGGVVGWAVSVIYNKVATLRGK